jgi:hypothetical protein
LDSVSLDWKNEREGANALFTCLRLPTAGFLTFATEFLAAFVKRMNGNIGAEDLKITHEVERRRIEVCRILVASNTVWCVGQILVLLAETVVDEDNATFIGELFAARLPQVLKY